MFPWWIHYPYQNNEILNLDWTLHQVKVNEENIKNFINLNTIKYADPILWDIEKQYEANTVVIDGITGNAYISTRPVPTGVSLSNTDYWTIIFNYQASVEALKHEICANDEGTSDTVSKDYDAGSLLWHNNKLIVITQDILAGTALIEDTESVGISGNFRYTTIVDQMQPSYDSDNKRLTIHGFVDSGTSVVSRGDYHVYNSNRRAIEILEVD